MKHLSSLAAIIVSSTITFTIAVPASAKIFDLDVISLITEPTDANSVTALLPLEVDPGTGVVVKILSAFSSNGFSSNGSITLPSIGVFTPTEVDLNDPAASAWNYDNLLGSNPNQPFDDAGLEIKFGTPGNTWLANIYCPAANNCMFSTNAPLVSLSGDWYNPGHGVNIAVIPLGTISVSSGVPEVSTWAMMILGLAGLGFAGLRTRRQAPALT